MRFLIILRFNTSYIHNRMYRSSSHVYLRKITLSIETGYETFCISQLTVALSTIGLFASGTQEQNKDNSLSYIQEKGTLILGLDDSFPPMGFRVEDGEIT